MKGWALKSPYNSPMNRSKNDLFLKTDFGGDNPLKTMQFVFFYTLFAVLAVAPEQFGGSSSTRAVTVSKDCSILTSKISPLTQMTGPRTQMSLGQDQFGPDQRDEPSDSYDCTGPAHSQMSLSQDLFDPDQRDEPPESDDWTTSEMSPLSQLTGPPA